MQFVTVDNGPIRLNVAVEGEGPLILCVHGWPELWYSWRHQLSHFSRLGYKVAAMDVRGYGGSSKPPAIADYTLKSITSDVVAVARALGGGKAILFGHDWGAPIVWTTAVLYPEVITAVAGLSVPYMPPSGEPYVGLGNTVYAGKFFYQAYFQTEGTAEAELEADVETSLRKIYFTLSGNAPLNAWIADKPADARLLDGMENPSPYPAWMSDADMAVYVEAFRASGFRGPINRYRAQRIDAGELAGIAGQPVTQPAAFIAGERDAVRSFVPGMDLYQLAGVACPDLRVNTIIPSAGHWVQQEAPAETNAALETFVNSL